MAEFTYQGRRQGSGEWVTGTCRAQDASAVASWLQEQGILAIRITPLPSSTLPWPFSPRLAPDELLFLTRQLAALCKAGLPLARGIQGLAESAISPLLKRLLLDVLLELQSGHSLATAFACHPKVFDPLFIKIVAMGEETGRLEEAFQQLHHHLSHQKTMRQRFADALRYPAMVVTAVLMAVWVVGIWVIPTFSQVFSSFGAQLPWMTRLLLSFSHFLTHYGMWVLLLLVALALTTGYLLTTPGGRRWWLSFLMRLPGFGLAFRHMLLARVAHGLAMGMASGLSLVKTLTMVADSVDHPLVEGAMATMVQQVDRGASFSSAAQSSGVFTPLALQMIHMGEESGQLDTLLAQTAEYYDSESRHAIATLQTYMEPILTLLVALLVLLLAMGVFLPMWDLGRVALRR
ncbi:MAG: type II secretion system F family protein [Magnetococcales bacterium]|nr:type II secretion system F family protein [Magnetococcales bacterium]NGZ27655.1 type II secretion system F family protein [Magnetococcales bacterium]